MFCVPVIPRPSDTLFIVAEIILLRSGWIIYRLEMRGGGRLLEASREVRRGEVKGGVELQEAAEASRDIAELLISLSVELLVFLLRMRTAFT